MEKIDDWYYKVQTAGYTYEMTVDVRLWSCGSLKDCIDFHFVDDEGGWSMSYRDLVCIALAATWYRLLRFAGIAD